MAPGLGRPQVTLLLFTSLLKRAVGLGRGGAGEQDGEDIS